MTIRTWGVMWVLFVSACTSPGPPASQDRGPIPDARRFPQTRDYYPAESGPLGESGRTEVNACVGADGKLTDKPTIVRSSMSPRLDDAAIKLAAAGSGYYLPAIHNGKAVARCFTFAVRFDSQDYSLTPPITSPAALPVVALPAEMPWAFNGRAAEGYSIRAVSVDPVPGTKLSVGSKITFTVSLSYAMTIASHGRVVLVVEDEQNVLLGPQSSRDVSGASGTLSLQQTIAVPSNAKEVRLFIPLVPDGLTTTYGEVTLRYPIVK